MKLISKTAKVNRKAMFDNWSIFLKVAKRDKGVVRKL